MYPYETGVSSNYGVSSEYSHRECLCVIFVYILPLIDTCKHDATYNDRAQSKLNIPPGETRKNKVGPELSDAVLHDGARDPAAKHSSRDHSVC